MLVGRHTGRQVAGEEDRWVCMWYVGFLDR